MELRFRSPEETEAFGRRLGAMLFPGAVLALSGTLGAGKTFLTRAIAQGLDVEDPALVSSPTFTLVHEYRGRLPIFHFDTYRLGSAREFFDLGIDEYFSGDGVCVIEWADRFVSLLPTERLGIHIEIVGDEERRVRLVPHGVRYQSLISSL